MNTVDLSPLTFMPRITVRRVSARTYNAHGARAVLLSWVVTARAEHPTTQVELDPEDFTRRVRDSVNASLWVEGATFLLSHVEACRAPGGAVIVAVSVVRMYAAREALPPEPWDALGFAAVEGDGGALVSSARGGVVGQWESHPPHAALLAMVG